MPGTGPRSSAAAKPPPWSPLPLDSWAGLGLCLPCFHPLDLETARFTLLPRGGGPWHSGQEIQGGGASLGIWVTSGRKGCNVGSPRAQAELSRWHRGL